MPKLSSSSASSISCSPTGSSEIVKATTTGETIPIVTEEEIEPKDDANCKCGVCILSEKEHKGKGRGIFEWVGCDCCGLWYMPDHV